jgi:hypothetical protein
MQATSKYTYSEEKESMPEHELKSIRPRTWFGMAALTLIPLSFLQRRENHAAG